MTTANSGEMTVDERYELIRSVGEECIQENELRNMVEKKPNIRCYDGFEPSGRMHIAQGILKAVNVNKCTSIGCEFVFWVADWFALMNDKVGGELAKIRIVGDYLIEVWKAVGMNMEKVLFLWSSNEITQHADTYWRIVLDIARRNTIARIKKCCTIMGKQEGTLTAAQILYPLMQCADIFFLKTDICQLGLDQRKVNMLAREYATLIGQKLKPVILSHHMLAGLKKGQAKMSKSDPDSAIFMEDTTEEVERKIRNAYCPCVARTTTEITEDGTPEASENKNPVLEYYQYIIYSRTDASTVIDGVVYKTYNELEEAFITGRISENALKETLITELNALLMPVRQHFASDQRAAGLLEKVKSFRSGNVVPSSSAEAALPPQSSTPLAVAWLPAANKLSMDAAVSMCNVINTFLQKKPCSEVVLVLPDWTAFSCGDATNKALAEEKRINAALELNLTLLQATWLPKERVRIVRQSQMILENSNDYWLAAINAGRRNLLQKVEEICGEFKSAGYLLAALMYVADTVILKATHVISAPNEHGYHELAKMFFGNRLSSIAIEVGVIPPLHRTDSSFESVDDIIFLDDTETVVRRKIKKAYCAPNEGANPVISIASWILRECGTLKIERAEENGGEKIYTSATELQEDALTGALHPADLKESVTRVLVRFTAACEKVLSSAEGKKHSQTLRQAEKLLTKKPK